MIIFNKMKQDKPYLYFHNKYIEAVDSNQESIDAMCISSYSTKYNQVNSRFVNLKFVEDTNFIFFSNYNSVKSAEFDDHPQVSVVIFWNSIKTQIRMRGHISKTSSKYNEDYFRERSKFKNALSISSNQSHKIESYQKVIDNYNTTYANEDLSQCPKYWGGYSFSPNYFEFWEGNESRLNKREIFEFNKDDEWKEFYLQP